MTSAREFKEGGEKVVFGGVDVREKYGGSGGGDRDESGSGSGGKGNVKGRRRGKNICEGVCCGAAWDLVCYLSKMGLIGVNSKVIIVLLL